jgi:hypothetical protein
LWRLTVLASGRGRLVDWDGSLRLALGSGRLGLGRWELGRSGAQRAAPLLGPWATIRETVTVRTEGRWRAASRLQVVWVLRYRSIIPD